MVIFARIGGSIEICIDDEMPGVIGYTPDHLEDLARRVGRQAVEMYEAIPARHMVAEDEAE